MLAVLRYSLTIYRAKLYEKHLVDPFYARDKLESTVCRYIALAMRLRIRGPSGQSVVNLDDTQTVENLRRTIVIETSLKSFDIKYGYPPKTLPLDQYPASTLLRDLDAKLNGEQLIVSNKTNQEVTDHTAPAEKAFSGLRPH